MDELIKTDDIQNKIITIRDKQVMLDHDLTEMYQVEVKRVNEQVKRNVDRFSEELRFQLTKYESENLKSQFATSSIEHGGKRKLPFVFTEQGVSMLSAVLRSDTGLVQVLTMLEKG